MDPHDNCLRVERMANGWIVIGGSGYERATMVPTGHVARTPKELADLILGWAQAQADLPTTPPRKP
jgi:hypothetical protein